MVKRYDFTHTPLGSFINTNDEGRYVTYEDYQKLQEQLGKAEEVLEWFNKRYTGEEGIYARQYFKEKER